MYLLCLLHWQVDSLPRRHQESPKYPLFLINFSSPFLLFCMMSSLPQEAFCLPICPTILPSASLLLCQGFVLPYSFCSKQQFLSSCGQGHAIPDFQ